MNTEMNIYYNIVYTGRLLPGFEVIDVVENFSKMSNIEIDKAHAYVVRSNKTYVKKNVSKSVALKYRNKLTAVGLEIKIYSAEKRNISKLTENLSNFSIQDAEVTQNGMNDKRNLNESNIIKSDNQYILSYTPFDRLSSIFYRFEATRKARWLASTIVAFALIGVFITFSNLPFRIDALLFVSAVLIPTLYVLSGVFKIEDRGAMIRAIIILLSFFSYHIYKDIYLNNDSIAKTLFSTSAGMGAIVIVLRCFAYMRK